MKHLIIENDLGISGSLQEILSDLEAELGSEFTLLANALKRNQEEVAKSIAEHDSIILQSTFTHKEQLGTLMSGFHAKAFGDKVYTFYVCGILRQLQKWTEPIMKGYLPDGHYSFWAALDWPITGTHNKFINELIDMVSQEQIILYDIRKEVVFVKKADDEVALKTRGGRSKPTQLNVPVIKGVAKRVLYSTEHQNFYFEGESPARD